MAKSLKNFPPKRKEGKKPIINDKPLTKDQILDMAYYDEI